MGLAVFTGILEEVTKLYYFLGVCGAANSVKSLKINVYSCMWFTQTASH
ncbi:hypothetical protein M595_2506 [Lyngbya aestuarii BL J]|uniref:Uncharacterized protein n=1 Tax=Lyngbya aestuarii BL J TaxID=1348334 RepID=U7QM46_9CYAN|nr:hypothetical protein M595_2506 [Lyngbya aestuarii BL J]